MLEALGLGAAGRVLRASRKKDGKEVPKRGETEFPSMGDPQHGCFIMENPIKMS